MQNQAYAFIVFILNGFLIGLLFDIFRILRKSFKTPDFITYIEDLIFWIMTGLLLIYSILKFNNGELRIYIFLGVILGVAMYLFIFSCFFINISVYIINLIKKIFIILLIIPIKFIIRILNKIVWKPFKNVLRHFKHLFIKILSILKNKTKKIKNKKRKNKNKKEFT